MDKGHIYKTKKNPSFLWLSIVCIGLSAWGAYFIDNGYEYYLEACHLPHLYFVPYIPYAFICLLALGALFCSFKTIRLCYAPNAGMYSRLAMILGLICAVAGGLFCVVGFGMESAVWDIQQQEREFEYQQKLERERYERYMQQYESQCEDCDWLLADY